MANQIVPHAITIMSWNANSVYPKRHELETLLDDEKFDVVLIQETFLRPGTNFKIKNYTTYRNDRLTTIGGGTAILIKSRIKHTLLPTPQTNNFEITSLKIHLATGPIDVHSVYKPPNKRLLNEELNLIFNSNNQVLIAGDLNSKSKEWGCRASNPDGIKLYKYVNENNIIILPPLEPTHYHHESPDILDIALHRNLLTDIHIQIVDELSSDHIPILITVGLNPTESPELQKTVNWQQFNSLLKNIPVQVPIVNNPIHLDRAVKQFTLTIKDSISQSTKEFARPSHNLHSLPLEIKNLIKDRNKIKKLAIRSLDPNLKIEANRLTNLIKSKIRIHKNEKWENLLLNASTEDNSLWNLKKALVHNSQPPNLHKPLHGRNGLVYSEEDKAEAFANSLEEQFSPNNSTQKFKNFEETVETYVPRLISNHTPTPIPNTTAREVKSIIKSLKVKKAPGPDLINNRALKNLPDSYISLLTYIINKSLDLNHFPDSWKIAKVILIPKPDKNHLFPQNWRPISLTNSASKILERIFLERFLPITENFIPKEQFGFVKQHSTEQQLARLAENATNGLQFNKSTGLVLLDIEKAFDKVWHEGLIYKFHKQYQIEVNYIHFLHSYLSNRKFYVTYGQYNSPLKTMSAGVPQGSVLGPHLYNLYTADIPKAPQTSLSIYADDTCCYTTDKNTNRILLRLNRQLQLFDDWTKNWKIKINSDKTEALFITRKLHNPQKHLIINKHPIHWKNTVNYLGVTLDKKLNWCKHIQNQIVKANKKRAILYPLINRKSKLTLSNKLLIYKQYIRPTLTYACVAWCQTSNANIHKIQIYQNKILRQITNSPWYIRNRDIRHDTKTETVRNHIKARQQTFFENLPAHPNPLLHDAFAQVPNTNTVTHKNLKTPIPRQHQ